MKFCFTKNIILPLFLLCNYFSYGQLDADFTSDKTSGCGNLLVQFTDLSSGSPTGWTWNFGDGGTSTNQNPAKFYNAPGTYTVTLTVTSGANSNTETKTAYIQVFALPTADFTQSDTNGCVPFTVNFTDASASSGSSIVSWLWNFGDGGTDTQKNPSHTYTVAGTYNVSLFVTDGNGCTNQKIKSNLVTVNTTPNASFNMNSTFSCIVPFNATFSNTSTGSGLSYLWNFGDGSPTSTSQNPSHSYSSFGTYNITLTVTASNGCTDDTVRTLTISQFTAGISANDSSICAGSPVNFSSTTIGATSWQWAFPGGSPASSTSQNPNNITYNSAGTFNVTLIAGNSQGCSDTVTMPAFITVNALPAVSFSADDSSACQVPFNVSFAGISATGTLWSWSFPGGSPTNSPSQTPTVTYNAAGSYNVSLTVTDNNGCARTTTINNFISVVFPTADFIALPDPAKGCIPLTVDFTDASSALPPATQWSWNFGDGSPLDVSQNPSHIYTDTGVFDVTLTITNAEGCTGTITKNAFVMAGQTPVADFSPQDTLGCHPFSVPFTNLSNSNVLNPVTDEWNWSFTNGITTYSSTQFSPTQTFSDTGHFEVTLISIHHGCADTIIISNAVYVQFPKPVFSASQNDFCDTPAVVTFTDQSLGAMQWLWKFGDATADFNGEFPPAHTYTLPGTYTVWLIAQNDTTLPDVCVDSVSATIRISEILPGFVSDTVAGCQPLPINFTDTSYSLYSITGRKWDFGDGIATPVGSGNITGVTNTGGTFISPVHTYSNSGFYSVTLILTDQLNCSDTITITNLIDVKQLPEAGFITDTANGCAPLSINFSDTSVSYAPLTAWQWNFGDAGSGTDSAITHVYQQRGQYTVTLIVTDIFNCTDTVVSSANYINATFPHPNFTFPATICNNASAAFTNSTTGSGVSYEWNFGDGTPIENSTDPNHLFIVGSDTTIVLDVMLTATDSNGCDSTLTKQITISIPQAIFTAGTQNALCPPFNASFTDASSADVTGWLWNFGDPADPAPSSLQNPSHTYENAGYYDVNLIVTNNFNCKDTLEIDSFIKVSGPSGTFTFTVDSNRCVSKADFTATTQNASSIVWVFGDGDTASANIVTHSYVTAGSYLPVLLMEDSNACQVIAVAANSIEVAPAVITANISNDTNNVYPEHSILFTGSVSPQVPVSQWEWFFGDGDSLITASEMPVKHRYDSTGTYSVTLKITDIDGCMATFGIDVTIIEGQVFSNVITPNGDGANDAFIIRRNGMKEHSIVIFNRWGEMIYEHTAPEIQWYGKNFSGAEVPTGTYFFVLISTRENGEVLAPVKSFLTLIR